MCVCVRACVEGDAFPGRPKAHLQHGRANLVGGRVDLLLERRKVLRHEGRTGARQRLQKRANILHARAGSGQIHPRNVSEQLRWQAGQARAGADFSGEVGHVVAFHDGVEEGGGEAAEGGAAAALAPGREDGEGVGVSTEGLYVYVYARLSAVWMDQYRELRACQEVGCMGTR